MKLTPIDQLFSQPTGAKASAKASLYIAQGPGFDLIFAHHEGNQTDGVESDPGRDPSDIAGAAAASAAKAKTSERGGQSSGSGESGGGTQANKDGDTVRSERGPLVLQAGSNKSSAKSDAAPQSPEAQAIQTSGLKPEESAPSASAARSDDAKLLTQKVELASTRLTAETFSESGTGTTEGGDQTPPHLKEPPSSTGASANVSENSQAAAPLFDLGAVTDPVGSGTGSAALETVSTDSISTTGVGVDISGSISSSAAVTGAAAADGESALIDTNQLNEQLGRALKTVIQQKGGSLTIKLNPPELGEVRIQLQMNGSVVRAQFDVSTNAVRALMQQQMSQLREALEQQGLTVEQLQVQTASASADANETDADGDDEGRSRGRREKQEEVPGEESGDEPDSGSFEDQLLDVVG
jgi:flagellar hook-length control protein FliK